MVFDINICVLISIVLTTIFFPHTICSVMWNNRHMSDPLKSILNYSLFGRLPHMNEALHRAVWYPLLFPLEPVRRAFISFLPLPSLFPSFTSWWFGCPIPLMYLITVCISKYPLLTIMISEIKSTIMFDLNCHHVRSVCKFVYKFQCTSHYQ